MFAYCGNNPINNSDYSGNRWLPSLADPGNVISSTIDDMMVILDESDEGLAVTKTSKSVQLTNSNKISTPWVQYTYSSYLNHNSEYKDYFTGTTTGMVFEWTVHNIGYSLFTAQGKLYDVLGLDSSKAYKRAERCENVDLGPTIFNDGNGNPELLNILMQGTYCILFPFSAEHDMFMYQQQ